MIVSSSLIPCGSSHWYRPLQSIKHIWTIPRLPIIVTGQHILVHNMRYVWGFIYIASVSTKARECVCYRGTLMVINRQMKSKSMSPKFRILLIYLPSGAPSSAWKMFKTTTYKIYITHYWYRTQWREPNYLRCNRINQSQYLLLSVETLINFANVISKDLTYWNFIMVVLVFTLFWYSPR